MQEPEVLNQLPIPALDPQPQPAAPIPVTPNSTERTMLVKVAVLEVLEQTKLQLILVYAAGAIIFLNLALLAMNSFDGIMFINVIGLFAAGFAYKKVKGYSAYLRTKYGLPGGTALGI